MWEKSLRKESRKKCEKREWGKSVGKEWEKKWGKRVRDKSAEVLCAGKNGGRT